MSQTYTPYLLTLTFGAAAVRVLLIFAVVYLIVNWELKNVIFKENLETNRSNFVTPLRAKFFDVLVMELGAVTQQGTDTESKSLAGQIATVSAFIAFMFLYISHSACIVFILQNTAESIKTLEDLLNSTISLGVEDTVYNQYYFKANQLNMYNQPYKWIIWGNTNHKIFEDLYFRLDSTVFYIEKIKKRNNVYQIKTLHKLAESFSGFLENDVAEWQPRAGFLTYNELYLRNRSNLMGLNLNVSYTAMFPDSFNHMEDFRDTHIDASLKVNAVLVKEVIEMLNITSTRIFRPIWGFRDPNTSFYNGMIGDLQSGMAEIAGNTMFFESGRIDIIEYILPCCPTYLRFIFRAPPLSSVIRAFDTYVWYSCFGLLPVIFAAVYLMVIWETRDPIFKRKTHHNSTRQLQPRVFDVLLMELGAATQQGPEAEPKSSAGRIATGFTFIALMLLYTAFSANVVGLLQSTTDSIKTAEDLVNSRMTLGVRNVSFLSYYFQTSREPVVKAVYEKVAPKGQKSNFMTLEEGISRTQKEFFAFQTEPSAAYKVIGKTYQESEKCHLKEVVLFNLIEPYVTIKKKSAYKEIIKVGLRKIMEAGIRSRLINRIFTKKPVCHGHRNNFRSVAILDCHVAFFIFGVGVGISVILFFLEIFVHKKMEERSQKDGV